MVGSVQYRAFVTEPSAAASATEAIDTAIAKFMESGGPQSETALAATGEAGLMRMLALWYGTASRSADSPIPSLSDRSVVDRWTDCLAVLARSAPQAFVEVVAD
jgi:hypothetical protein